MRAKEFIEQLADVTGLEVTELQTADKSLLQAGIRSRSRGRALVEVSRREGLQLLLGATGARRLTKAAEYVEAVQGLTCAGAPKDTSLLEEWFEVSRDELLSMPLIDVLLRICSLLAVVDPEMDVPPGTFSLQVSEHGMQITAQEIEPGHIGREASMLFRVRGREHPAVHRISIIAPSVLHWIARSTEAEG